MAPLIAARPEVPGLARRDDAAVTKVTEPSEDRWGSPLRGVRVRPEFGLKAALEVRAFEFCERARALAPGGRDDEVLERRELREQRVQRRPVARVRRRAFGGRPDFPKAAASFSASRPTIVTPASRAEKSFAAARPIPEVPPTMTTRCPASDMAFSHS